MKVSSVAYNNFLESEVSHMCRPFCDHILSAAAKRPMCIQFTSAFSLPQWSVFFTAIPCSLIISLLCNLHFHIFSVCKFSVCFLLFIHLRFIFIANIINVMIHCVNLWPLSMRRVRRVGKVAKCARNIMSLVQRLDVLDRLACGESCAFVSTFVCINESVMAMMWLWRFIYSHCCKWLIF
jgi:hypothetical protein